LSSALAASTATSLFQSTPESLKLMFEAFKAQHGVRYSTMEEESNRFAIFINNLKSIDERNSAERKAGGSASHGITRFSDLTPEEFASRYLTYTSTGKVEGTVVDVDANSSADWTGKYTTPVKDQGYCGSCWAFAASEQIESDAIRQLSLTQVLSPQQLVSCDKLSGGCNGGTQESAYNYVKRTGGIETEAAYPYSTATYNGDTGTCKSDSNKYVLTVSGYTTVKGETAMANYVLATGPLSVAVDATTWSSYTGGVMSSCGTSINHAVQAVGVDTGAGYWKIRNSWSPNWGENGYIRLAYGKSTCGVANEGATWVTAVKK